MHDRRARRADPLAFDSALARRGVASIAQSIRDLDSARRAIQTEVQAGLARRNEASKAIGQAKAKGDEATAGALMEEVSALKARLPELEAEERRLGEELDTRLAAIPNIPAADVPDGAAEEANVAETRRAVGRGRVGEYV